MGFREMESIWSSGTSSLNEGQGGWGSLGVMGPSYGMGIERPQKGGTSAAVTATSVCRLPCFDLFKLQVIALHLDKECSYLTSFTNTYQQCFFRTVNILSSNGYHSIYQNILDYNLIYQKRTCPPQCLRSPDLLQQLTNAPPAARNGMITAGSWDSSNNFGGSRSCLSQP